jgi:predicted SAM-dependent methyltransferase
MINELKLDLACGQSKTEGYFGVDIAPGDTVDAVVDLEQFPWPIESDSAEDIVCSHYVEHTALDTFTPYLKKVVSEVNTFEEFKIEILKYNGLIPRDGLIAFMNEVYRILKPGGKIKIVAPYYTSIRCWQDPTHRRAINDATFLYFNKGWREANKLDHYQVKTDCDFTYGYDMNAQWASRHEEARNFGITHYNNVINDIHIVLTKRESEVATVKV